MTNFHLKDMRNFNFLTNKFVFFRIVPHHTVCLLSSKHLNTQTSDLQFGEKHRSWFSLISTLVFMEAFCINGVQMVGNTVIRNNVKLPFKKKMKN